MLTVDGAHPADGSGHRSRRGECRWPPVPGRRGPTRTRHWRRPRHVRRRLAIRRSAGDSASLRDRGSREAAPAAGAEGGTEGAVGAGRDRVAVGGGVGAVGGGGGGRHHHRSAALMLAAHRSGWHSCRGCRLRVGIGFLRRRLLRVWRGRSWWLWSGRLGRVSWWFDCRWQGWLGTRWGRIRIHGG